MAAQDPDAQDTNAFYRMAEGAVAGFPQPFRGLAQKVVIQVVDWPPSDILDELGLSDPHELTGLYDGVPVTEKSPTDPAPYPDVVWLFRMPVLAEWRERGNVALEELVIHVTVHEFAHHFGWSDDDIAAIDRWWE